MWLLADIFSGEQWFGNLMKYFWKSVDTGIYKSSIININVNNHSIQVSKPGYETAMKLVVQWVLPFYLRVAILSVFRCKYFSVTKDIE